MTHARLTRLRDLLAIANRNRPLMVSAREQYQRDMAVEAYVGASDQIVALLSEMEADGTLFALFAAAMPKADDPVFVVKGAVQS